jgi:hypothetical protein
MCRERVLQTGRGDRRVHMVRCKPCHRALKRQRECRRERERRPDGVVPEATVEPDNAPARVLRVMLAEDRERNVRPFDDAWAQDLRSALESLHSPERRAWTEALEATREAWAAAYAGVPGPGESLSPEIVSNLVDRFDARDAAAAGHLGVSGPLVLS